MEATPTPADNMEIEAPALDENALKEGSDSKENNNKEAY